VTAGPALGGLDTQYKRNDFYPGVFQFGAEMAAYGLPPNMQVLLCACAVLGSQSPANVGQAVLPIVG